MRHASRADEPAVCVAEKFDGGGQHAELDAFLAGVLHFFSASRHLGLRAPVNQRGGFGAETAGGAHRVHGGIATADNDHVAIAAVVDRLVELRKAIGAHQVGAGEKFVGRVDAVEVLAGHAEKYGQARAGGDKDCVVAFDAHQFIERDAFADDDVGFEFDAHAAQVVDFLLTMDLGRRNSGMP